MIIKGWLWLFSNVKGIGLDERGVGLMHIPAVIGILLWIVTICLFRVVDSLIYTSKSIEKDGIYSDILLSR